jgi:hypothetical protein
MPTWVAPPLGWIKLNVDVGFDPTTKHAGLDFIARNHLGQVIFSGWCNDRLCNPAKEVEIRCTLSVFQGLMCFGIRQPRNNQCTQSFFSKFFF